MSFAAAGAIQRKLPLDILRSSFMLSFYILLLSSLKISEKKSFFKVILMRNLISKMFKLITICFEQALLNFYLLQMISRIIFSCYNLFRFVISLNVGYHTKVAHGYLHTQLLMAIRITILSISRPPLNSAAVINYLHFVLVVKDLNSIK